MDAVAVRNVCQNNRKQCTQWSASCVELYPRSSPRTLKIASQKANCSGKALDLFPTAIMSLVTSSLLQTLLTKYTLRLLTVLQCQHVCNCWFETILHMNIELYNIVLGLGSSVGIASDYGLDGPGSNPGGDEIFRPSRPALGPTQPPVKWVPSFSRGLSAAGAYCWPLTPC